MSRAVPFPLRAGRESFALAFRARRAAAADHGDEPAWLGTAEDSLAAADDVCEAHRPVLVEDSNRTSQGQRRCGKTVHVLAPVAPGARGPEALPEAGWQAEQGELRRPSPWSEEEGRALSCRRRGRTYGAREQLWGAF